MLSHFLSSFVANKIASAGVSTALVLGGGAAAEASGVGPQARHTLGSTVESVTAAVNGSGDGNAQQLVGVAPVAENDEAATDEDQSVVIDVLANDTDEDGEVLAVLEGSLSDPANGTVELNLDGTITYTPAADFHGADGFDYTATDGNGGEATASVAVAVKPVNDDPVAEDDEASVDEDESVVIDVLANDTDVDRDTLEVLAGSLTTPANGTVELNLDGTITYTPAADFYGDDGFEYTATDGNGGEATASVAVTVNPVQDDPVAADDEAVATVDEPLSIDVLANDTDVDGDELTVDSATDPAHGTVVVEADGTLTYTPEAAYEGDDGFEYTISDGNGGFDTATVTLSVVTAKDAAELLRDECKDGGWEELGYRNQGLCVSYYGNGREAIDGPPWPLQEQWDARRAELDEKRGKPGDAELAEVDGDPDAEELGEENLDTDEKKGRGRSKPKKGDSAGADDATG